MGNNENPKKTSTLLEDMVTRGELIPTAGPPGKEIDPLRDLSCKDVLIHLPDFCNGRIGGNELFLEKMKKHLKDSIPNRCGCAVKFAELNKTNKS